MLKSDPATINEMDALTLLFKFVSELNRCPSLTPLICFAPRPEAGPNATLLYALRPLLIGNLWTLQWAEYDVSTNGLLNVPVLWQLLADAPPPIYCWIARFLPDLRKHLKMP